MTATQAFAPSAFTSPDIRPSGMDALKNLDMQAVREELAAALHHIENLPRQYPDDGSSTSESPPPHPLNTAEKERWK